MCGYRWRWHFVFYNTYHFQDKLTKFWSAELENDLQLRVKMLNIFCSPLLKRQYNDVVTKGTAYWLLTAYHSTGVLLIKLNGNKP